MGLEPDRIGAWSPRGEFLGVVTGRDAGVEVPQTDYLSAGRGGAGGGVSATLHRFSRGGEEGYRVQVRLWDGDEEHAYWLAPTVEDAGYIGMFTEEEARREFPYLFAALQMPKRFEIG